MASPAYHHLRLEFGVIALSRRIHARPFPQVWKSVLCCLNFRDDLSHGGVGWFGQLWWSADSLSLAWVRRTPMQGAEFVRIPSRRLEMITLRLGWATCDRLWVTLHGFYIDLSRRGAMVDKSGNSGSRGKTATWLKPQIPRFHEQILVPAWPYRFLKTWQNCTNAMSVGWCIKNGYGVRATTAEVQSLESSA